MFNCMDKVAICDFFDRLAPEWDDRLIVDEGKMAAILDAARITRGSDVLDVACGTGVMVDFYLDREVGHVTAIDLSPRMVDIFDEKFQNEDRVDVICGDAEVYDFGTDFDAVMVFNAFPHFPDPAGIILHLAEYVKPGGTLTIAHDMGRKRLDEHHSGCASKVSHGMMHEDDVAALLEGSFADITKVSNADMFIVSGSKVA